MGALGRRGRAPSPEGNEEGAEVTEQMTTQEARRIIKAADKKYVADYEKAKAELWTNGDGSLDAWQLWCMAAGEIAAEFRNTVNDAYDVLYREGETA